MEFWGKSVTNSGLLNFSMTSVRKRGLLKFQVISLTKNEEKLLFRNNFFMTITENQLMVFKNDPI